MKLSELRLLSLIASPLALVLGVMWGMHINLASATAVSEAADELMLAHERNYELIAENKAQERVLNKLALYVSRRHDTNRIIQLRPPTQYEQAPRTPSGFRFVPPQKP